MDCRGFNESEDIVLRFWLAPFSRRLAVPQTEGIEGALFLSPRAGDEVRLGEVGSP